ncbi:MAG: hypothetical protein LBK50_00880, partial [Candidatus Nomurabacteria bacterium]|nr:hypothetical protein [Candidatus Nomurabacteria bacterium]
SSTEAGAGDGYGNVCSSYSTAIGQLASTTGNMYGVYDMAAGVTENTQANRGGSFTTYTATMPQTKYIDTYYVPPFGTQPSWSSSSSESYYNFDNCLFESCGGHSLHEARTRQSISSDTQSWGLDTSSSAYYNSPWFERGGDTSSSAGIWNSYNTPGYNFISIGFRVIAQNIAKTTSITAQEKAIPFSSVITDNNITTMQALTSSICQSADYDSSNGGINENNTVTLTDTRANNQAYLVRKLADGNCWMIDNLKLELKNGMVLSPVNTNVTSDTTIYFTQNGAAGGVALDGMTYNFTTSGYLTRDNTNANGYDGIGENNYTAWRQVDPSNIAMCKDNYYSGNGNGDITYNNNSKTGCGYLYNFYTAAAGTVDRTKTNGEANGSICPAGWKLPSGRNSSGDYGKLDLAYQPGGTGTGGIRLGDDVISQNLWLSAGAWQGTLSGMYVSEIIKHGEGYYWSSSIVSNSAAYFALFSIDFVGPGSASWPWYYGYAVRCLVG